MEGKKDKASDITMIAHEMIEKRETVHEKARN